MTERNAFRGIFVLVKFFPNRRTFAHHHQRQNENDQGRTNEAEKRVEKHVDQHGRRRNRGVKVDHFRVHQTVSGHGQIRGEVRWNEKWFIEGNRFDRWNVEQGEEKK